jgi:hypothetical protein
MPVNQIYRAHILEAQLSSGVEQESGNISHEYLDTSNSFPIDRGDS